jgi:YHS domain-containing protein/thiol-disulfide isomerase/thioredoxin
MTRPISRTVLFGAGLFVTMALVSLATASARGAGEGTIHWRVDLRQALQEARERNIPVWVQFTGPWCPSCVRMEQESLTDPRVVASSRERFVPVKLRTDLHEALVAHFGLEGIPATIILKPSGEVVSRSEGFIESGPFLALLGDALARSMPVRQIASTPVRTRNVPTRTIESQARPEPEVSLAGYCPVSLVRDHRLVPGQPDQRLEHDGHEYRFADSGMRSMFRSQPERFIPVNAGRCPVDQVDRGESVAGDPRWGVLYQGHLYLCADRQRRERFLKNPERYAYADAADRGTCPHCWTREGLANRGPRPSIARSPRRSLHPALVPLEASRLSTDRVLR